VRDEFNTEFKTSKASKRFGRAIRMNARKIMKAYQNITMKIIYDNLDIIYSTEEIMVD